MPTGDIESALISAEDTSELELFTIFNKTTDKYVVYPHSKVSNVIAKIVLPQ